MTTTTTGPARHVPPDHAVTFGGLVRSEWVKLWSVRSLAVTLVVTALGVVAVSALLAGAGVLLSSEADEGTQGAVGLSVETSMVGAQLASLVAGVLGVLTITGEYSSGLIRTSLLAVPRRLPVLWAKAVVLAAAVSLVLGAAVLAAFFLGQALLGVVGDGVGIGEPQVLRVLVGNVVVLVGIALAGLGVGAVLRSTAGAICALAGLLFVLPLLLLPLPGFPGKDLLMQYHFSNTTSALTLMLPEEGTTPSVASSALAFAAWVALLLACGALALRRRDV